MKYFTKEWWERGCEDAQPLFQRYEAYLASVRSQLPPELVAFDAAHTLHDSEVKRIICNFEYKTVTLVIHGWNQKLE